MTGRITGVAVALGALALSIAGCAQGGERGRRDGGSLHIQDSGARPRPDAAPTPMDSGSVPTCSESPCRLVSPQCGCGAGQACYVDTTGARACTPSGPAREGETCGEGSACQPGLMCLGISTTQAACSRFCETDADCVGGPGSICVFGLDDGTGGMLPGVKLCSTSCNPATSAGCPSGTGCAVLQETTGAMRVLTACRAAGTASTDAPCTTDDDCRPGHFCGDPGSGSVCVQYCVGDSDCTFGVCNPFATPITIGSVTYGFCY